MDHDNNDYIATAPSVTNMVNPQTVLAARHVQSPTRGSHLVLFLFDVNDKKKT